MTELVTLKTIAGRLGYSVKYVQNHWGELLAGVRPLNLGPNRKKLFEWREVERILAQPK